VGIDAAPNLEERLEPLTLHGSEGFGVEEAVFGQVEAATEPQNLLVQASGDLHQPRIGRQVEGEREAGLRE
jgi:hypothetical protein